MSQDGSASDRAYAWTRGRILRGELRGGDMISEGDVSASVGVSRTPVREAFLRLEAEGYLKLYPKRGAMVVPVTEADTREMLEARLLIEPWAAEQVARRDDRAAIAASLRREVDQLVDAHRRRDLAAYHDADRTFHESILDASRNHLVASFYQGLRDRQLRAGAMAVQVAAGREDEIPLEHRRIVDAIEAGDAESAALAMRAHIATTWKALLGDV
jgi:DNA-binding GntR family transcriptional regulator